MANYKTDRTFRRLREVIHWVEVYISDLVKGLSELEENKLSPSLIKPNKLRKILKAVFDNRGQTSLRLFEDQEKVSIWKFYKEMRVTTASLTNGFRSFIEIPIYDDNQKLTLYRVYNVPIYSENSPIGSIYEDMPEYVALHSRKTAYIGLMKKEIEQCIEGTVKMCPIRKPIYPVKNGKGEISCVMNQLLYEGKSLTSCDQQRIISEKLQISFPFNTKKKGKISEKEFFADYGNLSFLNDFEPTFNFQNTVKPTVTEPTRKNALNTLT